MIGVNLEEFLKNIKDVSSTRIFVIGMVMCSMFFYLDIYIFGKWLIEKEPIQIPIILSLCLGFLWHSIFLVHEYYLRGIDMIENPGQTIENNVYSSSIFKSITMIAWYTGGLKILNLLCMTYLHIYWFTITPFIILVFTFSYYMLGSEMRTYRKLQKKLADLNSKANANGS